MYMDTKTRRIVPGPVLLPGKRELTGKVRIWPDAPLDVSGPDVALHGPNDDNDDVKQNPQSMIVIEPNI